VYGEGAERDRARHLSATAAVRYAVNKSIVCLTREQVSAGVLPPSLAETIPHLPQLAQEGSFAVVCRGNLCLPPITEVEELAAALKDV
jgi:uncharacterized protein YyaL (SSP411 family)